MVVPVWLGGCTGVLGCCEIVRLSFFCNVGWALVQGSKRLKEALDGKAPSLQRGVFDAVRGVAQST